MKYGELQRSIPYEEVNEIYEKQKARDEIKKFREKLFSRFPDVFEYLEGTKDEKIALLEVMSGIDPFSAYPQVIEKIKKELLA